MYKLGDTVRIKDLNIIGEISDIDEENGYCYVDVSKEDLNGYVPELAGCAFSKKLEEIEPVTKEDEK